MTTTHDGQLTPLVGAAFLRSLEARIDVPAEREQIDVVAPFTLDVIGKIPQATPEDVAAAVALAGSGFDHTGVKLIADPSIDANIHELHATGAFGSFSFRIEGRALPDNPKSSALAAMSAVAAIRRLQVPITG